MKDSNKSHYLLIFILGFLVYFLSLGNQFLWDDETQIVGNSIIHSLSNIGTLFTGGIVYTPGQNLSGGFYRPILNLALMLLYAISSHPFIFRLFQVLVHLLNSVLVYLLFRQFLSNKLIALFSALIFAIHPGISEGVLFISGLGEPLFTLFLLLSLYAYPKNQYLSLLFFFFSLLTKETAIIFLGIIFCMYHLITIKAKFRQFVNYLFVTTVYLTFRFAFVGYKLDNLKFPTPIAQLDLTQRLLNIPYEIIYYLLLFIFPYHLAIMRQPVIKSISDPRFIISTVLLMIFAFAIAALIRITKSKLLIVFVSWFLLGILPVLNIIPLSATVAERWLYFPIIGILGIIAVVIIHHQSFIRKYKLIFISLMTGYLTILSIRTIIRTTDWKNGLTLYQHDLTINPDSFDLVNNFGVELFRLGKISEAKPYFEKSIALNPKWWTAYNNLGVVLENENKIEEAKQNYQKSIETGNYYLAYENLARIYVKNKDYDQAINFLEKNLQIYPSAKLYDYYAISLYQTGKKNEALKQAKIAQDTALFQLILNNEKLE